MLVLTILHPVIYIVDQMVPVIADQIFCGIIAGLLVFDFISILYVIRKKTRLQNLDEIQKHNQENKIALGNWIYHAIWNRLNRAYPNMESLKRPEESAYIFAHGICFDKLVWVFLISALAGDVIETFYCRFVSAGVWMSRSSVIYGPFSIVWGMGAVLLTVVLQKLAAKDDRYVFLSGCVLGGVYEYMCSVLSEVFLDRILGLQ